MPLGGQHNPKFITEKRRLLKEATVNSGLNDHVQQRRRADAFAGCGSVINAMGAEKRGSFMLGLSSHLTRTGLRAEKRGTDRI